jgi:hypothetical protein
MDTSDTDTTTTRRNAQWCSPSTRIIIPAIFLLLGVGILMPWNAFISAKGYFQSRVCSETGEPANASIESWFAMIYNGSSVISLGLLILLGLVRDQMATEAQAEAEILDPLSSSPVNTSMGNSLTNHNNAQTNESSNHNTSDSSKAHAFWLVMLPLALYLAVFLFTDLLVLAPSISIDLFKVLTLVCLAVCGMCGAIASAGIVATAGLFPSDLAMNPFLAGQSVGGVAVSFANFVAACLEDPSLYWDAHCSGDVHNVVDRFGQASVWQRQDQQSYPLRADDAAETCVAYEQRDWAVFFYFFMGTLVLGCCLLGYAYIDRFQRRRHRDEYETIDSDTDEAAADDVEVSPRIGLELNDSSLRADGVDAPDRLIPKPAGDLAEPETITEGEDSIQEESEPNNDTVAAWSHVKGPATCIFLTFFVTLSLFPGWTSELQSVRQCRTHFRLSNDLYTPFSFLLFNVGDLLGRLLSAKITQNRIGGLSTKLVKASLLRFIFFPLLFMCVGGSGFQIQSDLYSLLIQFSFAVSNGLLVSTAFVHAPTLLPGTTHMQERSSEILTFAVAFGLLSGSLFSFPVSSFGS